MKPRALLDVNLLVALFDPDHVHHELAHDWFADNRSDGWATCPLTENGLVRVLTHPKYGSPVATIPAVLERLRALCATRHHEFWVDELSFRDERIFVPALVHGHRQLTDVYLLGLAVAKGGRLATFNQSIPPRAVTGATLESLTVIGAVGEDE